MKFFSVLLAAGVASVASAATLESLVVLLPPCAVTCLNTYVKQVCPKGLADFECECAKQSKITSLSQKCILSGCSIKEATQTLRLTGEICHEFKKDGYSGDPTNGTITTALTEIPPCAIGCFQDIIPKYCHKGLADFACQCAKISTLTPPLTKCVQGPCSNQQALLAKRQALKICALYNQAEGGGSSGSGSGGGTGSTGITTPTVPTGFTGPGSNDAPLATAGPIGAAIAAAIAFAL